ncbi:MAG: ThuA domain-containing protein [Brevinematales bacterium]|nr:ThuA domain-containing protein [Brevinematales bacterium]
MNKKILFLGGGNYHPIEEMFVFREILKNINVDIIFTEDNNSLLKENIKNFDLIIFSKTDTTLTNEQSESLKEAIIGNPWGEFRTPKNFIGIHAASTTKNEWFTRMLGGAFLTHPKISTIKIYKERSRLTENFKNFEIEDELYLMEYFPPFNSLLYTYYEEFKIPLAWIKNYGLGKVFYCALGHTGKTFENKNVIKLIQNIVVTIMRVDK